jgi:deoxyinosine 3'endonuclease (endonuclease V)
METGERPKCDVCAAVDVHYLKTGGARAAAVLAADAAFAHVLAERTAVVPRVPPYRPGEFYLRELPPLRAVQTDAQETGKDRFPNAA